MATLTYTQFVGYLRSALHYLYDPDQLRRNPLAVLFGVAGRSYTPSALQSILTEAIEGLCPPADEPPQSRAWRIYDALVYRYVRRLERDAVAEQLGISGRQLRREQRAALETLADRLWQQYDLEGKTIPPAAPETSPTPDAGTPPVGEELAWLKEAPPDTPTDLGQLLQTVLRVVHPLALEWEVTLQCATPDGLPHLAVRQAALHHALLSLLSIAIPSAQGGPLCISAAMEGQEIEIHVEWRASSTCAAPAAEIGSSLDVARQLAELCGGRLILANELESFRATLAIPAPAPAQVLVIDDNADFVQLLQRYVTSTPYTIVGTRDPTQALALVARLSPQAIILDVMMPGVDGWEMLAQLRQHPRTGQVPIVICSILPQEALARPLGANAFLRKPVSRTEFLHVLDELL